MSEKLMKQAWESYRKMVVPNYASSVQVTETRQAFYSGASILFSMLTGPLLDEGDDPTDADLQKMADLQIEFDTFGAELDLKVLGIIKH